MRRLILICCTILATLSLSAEIRRSDVLLTDAGVFYRIDTLDSDEFRAAHTESPLETTSVTILALTIQDGDEILTIPVPSTLTGGLNIEPSLAYDPDDDRVYVFWQRKPSPSTSELMLTSYKDGVWTTETAFDNGTWRLRFNLRIGITHYMSGVDEDGTPFRERAAVAHAVWWEQHGQVEAARYAMINLEAGEVRGLTIRDMRELSSLEALPEVRELPEDFDKTTFRTPFILDVPGNDSVDILFADWYTNHYEIVNVRPVLDQKNGVLHIPIGVTTGVMDAPRIRTRDVDNGLVAVSESGADGSTNLLIYSTDETAIDYVIFRNGEWSTSKSIAIRENITLGDGLQALRRNLRGNY